MSSALQPSSALLAVICGPTGSGKSALAVRLAKAFTGEIVNYDSVQVFRGLDIGSAKTPPADRAGVPHHLLDIVEPTDDMTAGVFARLARTVLPEIDRRGALPILVGGTGFYLRSLLLGLPAAPERNPCLRSRLAQLGARRPMVLHRFLRRLNSAAATRIHANDHQKLIRGIEVASTTLQQPPPEPLAGFHVVKIGLDPDRAQLYRALDNRSASMFETDGILQETQALLDDGVPPEARALQSLGYRQAVTVLQGGLTLPEAVNDLQTKTRQYAKRQMTWFRREPDVYWLRGFGSEDRIQQAALEHIASFLS